MNILITVICAVFIFDVLIEIRDELRKLNDKNK